MRPVRFALAISHTPWVEERVQSMARLCKALDIEGPELQFGRATPKHNENVPHVLFQTERAPNWVWSENMWKWAVEFDATHCVFLQDDARVSPDFWRDLRQLVEAFPDHVICLEVVHPAALALAQAGEHVFTTTDGMVGVGYVLPRFKLANFLEWRKRYLKEGALEKINEDTLLGLWCMVAGERILHPLPTIIDHDVSLSSTYGNDSHSARRPVVRWDTYAELVEKVSNYEIHNWWQDLDADGVVHVGRFPGWTIPELARQWVEGVTELEVQKWKRDDGHRVLASLSARIRSEALLKEPKATIVLCTPAHGALHPRHHESVLALHWRAQIDVVSGAELLGGWTWEADVVRTRSRFVRAFLETNATHLLFVDADVSFDPAVVLGMLATGKDFVACPYPRREGVDFEGVATGTVDRPPEAYAYAWSVTVDDRCDHTLNPDSTTEIASIGLGCALLSRKCLENMVEHYGPTLTTPDLDRKTGRKIPTVWLFLFTLEAGDLPSEDVAFCRRWRAMGGRVWLYLGEGSPASHHGDHHYRGLIESFGIRRVTT